MGHDEILQYLQSLDRRLADLNAKMDSIINGDIKLAGVVTDEKCNKCQTQWVEKKLVLAWGAGFTGVNGFILMVAYIDKLPAAIRGLLGG